MSPLSSESQSREHLAAQLTAAAYQAVLEQGSPRSFVEIELSLWNAIRRIVYSNDEIAVTLGRNPS